MTRRPTLLLMAGRSIGSAASFLIPIVLVRVFDQTQFGTYKQLFLIYATLYGIAQVGMAESLFYFVPLHPGTAGRCVTNSILSLAAAGAICWAFLSGMRVPVARWLGNEALSPHLPALGAFLLLMLASTVLEIVMTSRKQYLWASVSYGLSDLVKTALFVLPALLFRSVEALLFGAIVAAVIRACVTLAYLRHEFGDGIGLEWPVLRRQLGYAVPFGAAALLGILESNFHQYAVSHAFDAATFAVYSVGCLQIPLVDLVAGSACNVMMVRMAEALRDGAEGELLETWRDTTLKLTAFFLPLAGLLLVVARDLVVVLFTSAYAGSVPILMIWSATVALAALQVDGVLRVFADTRFLLGLYAAKLVIIASCTAWFIGMFHLAGAVLITTTAILAAKLACLVRIKTLMRVPLARLLPWGSLARMVVTTATAGLVTRLVLSRLVVPAFGHLLMGGLVFALLLMGLGRLLRVIPPHAGGLRSRGVSAECAVSQES